MTREIKFRAWKKEFTDEDSVQGMYYTSQGEFKISWIDFDKEELAVEIDYFETELGNSPEISIIDFGDCELMQSTGLLDKNGKEIFEKDILAGSAVYEFEHDGLGIARIGKFSADSSGGEYESVQCYGVYIEIVKSSMKDSAHGSFYHESLEVVGNIYENPELLGRKEESNG
jgi:uncharacterized phage protein (TIGR01671 family)